MQAVLGLFSVDKAVRFVNPETPVFVMAHSLPPAKHISAYPCFIYLKASPILFVPEAHAVTTASHTPFAPNLRDIFPAAIFNIAIGIKSGEIFPGPFSSTLLI